MKPRTPIDQVEFVAFDLETTGLHPVTHQIIEIGAVRFRGDGEVLGQFQQLIDPKAPIDREASRVHGITASMLKGQPLLIDVLPRFLEFLGESPVVMLAHNARFDLGFLSVALRRTGQAFPAHQTLDTCALSRQRVALPRHNLETLGRHLGLIQSEAHRALEDAILLKDVFTRLVQRTPELRNVEDVYRVCSPLGLDAFAVIVEHPPKGHEALWSAMANRQPIDVRYAGGTASTANRRITPRAAFRMHGEVYVSAHCHREDCEKTYRLDRMLSYHPVPDDAPRASS